MGTMMDDNEVMGVPSRGSWASEVLRMVTYHTYPDGSCRVSLTLDPDGTLMVTVPRHGRYWPFRLDGYGDLAREPALLAREIAQMLDAALAEELARPPQDDRVL